MLPWPTFWPTNCCCTFSVYRFFLSSRRSSNLGHHYLLSRSPPLSSASRHLHIASTRLSCNCQSVMGNAKYSPLEMAFQTFPLYWINNLSTEISLTVTGITRPTSTYYYISIFIITLWLQDSVLMKGISADCQKTMRSPPFKVTSACRTSKTRLVYFLCIVVPVTLLIMSVTVNRVL